MGIRRVHGRLPDSGRLYGQGGSGVQQDDRIRLRAGNDGIRLRMAKKTLKPEKKKTVETLTHEEASRKNIPTAEFQSVMQKDQQTPVRVAYERRNRDLDPQLVWRGKDEQDWSDLVTHAPPIYIQEKVHPKVLIDDLLRRSKAEMKAGEE